MLTAEQLAELAAFPTPTISNAIEQFDVRPRGDGFLPHTIRSLTPSLPPIVGYAVTATTRAAIPNPRPDRTADYFRYVASVPGTKIAVGQDLDNPPGLGAQFGEVTAAIHQKLNCVGHITSGCPRDLDEVRSMGFALFGLNPCVSHAYVHLVDFGQPITIAGVAIPPGQLLHADQHGVCLIPHEIAGQLANACREVERLERPLIDACKRPDFDLERYLALRFGAAESLRE